MNGLSLIGTLLALLLCDKVLEAERERQREATHRRSRNTPPKARP
jgi:hypothetical protein